MNLNFNTGTGIPITLDGAKEPSFYMYPNDMDFIEKATSLYEETKKLSNNIDAKYKEMNIVLDENGAPTNSKELIELSKQDFNAVLEMFDDLLGEGVSKKVFKGKVNFQKLYEFIEFITEVITENRTSTVKKYKKDSKNKVL